MQFLSQPTDLRLPLSSLLVSTSTIQHVLLTEVGKGLVCQLIVKVAVDWIAALLRHKCSPKVVILVQEVKAAIMFGSDNCFCSVHGSSEGEQMFVAGRTDGGAMAQIS